MSKTQSQTIARKDAVRADAARLAKDAQAIHDKAAKLREQLADLEAAAEADTQAVAAATAALASALEAGDADAVTQARNRAAAASKGEAKASARLTEIAALKAAIAVLEDKARSLGLMRAELREQEKALAGERLRELAGELAADYAAAMQRLAEIAASAQALNAVAERVGAPGGYAPPPYVMPSLIGEGLAMSGRMVIDLSPLRQKAIGAMVDRLHVEGFTGV